MPEPMFNDRFVIQISVDGLRTGDATRNLQSLIDAGLAPAFARLQAEAAWTHNARTDNVHTNTLPNHTAMLTSRPVEDVGGPNTGHKYRFNDDPEDIPALVPLPVISVDTIHNSAGYYVPSTFNVVHDNGGSTALYATKTKFSLFDDSYDGVDSTGTTFETTGLALDTTGSDNGFDKLDRAFIGGVAETVTRLIDDAASADGLADYTFVHIRSPDEAGHAQGWGSDAYIAAIIEADAQIGRILAMIDADPDLAGHVNVIVSADHGGGGDAPVTDAQHANPASPLNFTIPFYVWGPDVTPGADVYALNEDTRDDPAADLNPVFSSASSTQPIRNSDGGNLALDILDLPAIPGSLVNATQNLRIDAGGVLTLHVAQDAYLGNAEFVVLVDGQQVGGVRTATTLHDSGTYQAITISGLAQVPDSVAVEFINDRYGGAPALDRNLWVDGLTFNGQFYSAEDATNTGGPAQPDEAVLAINGRLTFDLTPALSVRVSGDSYQGDAEFVVLVDGQQVGGVRRATASHADGEWQDISIGGVTDTPATIALRFINDRYDGSPTADRNLYVDAVTLNGVRYEGESGDNEAGFNTTTEAILPVNGALAFDFSIMM